MSTPLKKLSPTLNAYTCQFDESLLLPLRQLYNRLIAPTLENHPHLLKGDQVISTGLHAPDYKFFATTYNDAPLLWISSDDHVTYQVFKNLYDALNIEAEIKKLIDYDQHIVVYSGFFVVGDHLDKELWHVDYFDNANAFTLISPLFDLDAQHGRLLYADEQQVRQRYEYKTGEAIIFGDTFLHTTEPYPKNKPRVLFSLAFGTDKTQYWEILEKTIGAQSRFMYLPCGHQAGKCECVVLKHRANYAV